MTPMQSHRATSAAIRARCRAALLALAATAVSASAQTVGFVGSDPLVLVQPGPVVPDSTGHVFVAGAASHNLLRLAPDGTATAFAAVGADLPAPFVRPSAVAVDSADNVYVACVHSDNVFRFTPAGVASVVLDATGDGLGNTLDAPDSLAIDADDNVWVGSSVDDTVFRVSPAGAVSFVLDESGPGTGGTLYQLRVQDVGGRAFALAPGRLLELDASGPPVELIGPDGDGMGNGMGQPRQVVIDTIGRVLARDASSVFRVSLTGTVGKIFTAADELAADGTGSLWFLVAGPVGPGFIVEREANGNQITYMLPPGTASSGLLADGDGNAWYLQHPTGTGDFSTTLWQIADGGSPTIAYASPGAGGAGLLDGVDPAFADDGSVWVVGELSDNIVRIVPFVGDDEVLGPPAWSMYGMRDLDVDRWGRIVAAGDDIEDSLVRYDPVSGAVELLADGADGLANPHEVVTDSQGNVWVATFFDEVLRIDPAGEVTVALDATGDGVHALDFPWALAVDALDNVYVSGAVSDNVFRIAPDGAVTQIVDVFGDGAGGFLGSPRSLAVGPDGAVYVAGFDSFNVLRVDPDGTVTEVINGVTGAGAALIQPTAVAVARDGTVYVASSGNDVVFAVTPAGVASLAVLPTDGPLDLPEDLEVDAFGSLYVLGADSGNVLRRDPDGSVEVLLEASGAAAAPGTVVMRRVALSASGDVVVSPGFSAYPLVLSQDEWFTDLGGSSPGVAGHPELRMKGTLAAGSPTDLVLTQAPPGALVLAWLSFAPTPFDALGGTVHAFPANVQRLFATNGAGQFAVSVPWPAGLPAGTDVHLQFIVQDGSVPDGLTLSNGVVQTTP